MRSSELSALLSRQEHGGDGDAGQGVLLGLQVRVRFWMFYPDSEVSLHLTILSDQLLALSSVLPVVIFIGICN